MAENTWDNGSGRRLVEELDSDDDSDTQGANLLSTRFSSDPLRFTGIDMGGSVARRRNHAYEHSEHGSSSGDSDDDTELDEKGTPRISRDEEDDLVDSAMRRIRKAQASGKKDVRLSRKELAALEIWRKRTQADGESRKRKRKQRISVPLAQVAPTSQNENRLPQASGAFPSTDVLDRQNGQPPVGWFAHPSSSRPESSESRRRHSKVSAPDRAGSTSPFQYHYVQQPGPVSNLRHTSDPTVPLRSSRGTGPHEDPVLSQYNPSASMPSVPLSLDPFRYMTSGAPTPHHSGSASSLRNVSGSSAGQDHFEPSYRGGASAARRQSRHFTPDDDDDDSSSEEDDSGDDTSDEIYEGARIGNSPAGPSTVGPEQIVVEVEREPTPERRVTRSKKVASRAPSPKASPKRKAGGGGTSRRKRGSK